MIKITIGIVIVFLCTYLGFKFSQKYVKRRKFYNDLLAFSNLLKDEVSFGKRTIKNLIDENTFNDEMSSLLDNFLSSMTENVEFVVDKTYLTDIEKNSISGFFYSIGKSDADTQTNIINGYRQKFEDCSKKAEEDEKKYRALYVKLGFLIGLIAFVIIL